VYKSGTYSQWKYQVLTAVKMQTISYLTNIGAAFTDGGTTSSCSLNFSYNTMIHKIVKARVVFTIICCCQNCLAFEAVSICRKVCT